MATIQLPDCDVLIWQFGQNMAELHDTFKRAADALDALGLDGLPEVTTILEDHQRKRAERLAADR